MEKKALGLGSLLHEIVAEFITESTNVSFFITPFQFPVAFSQREFGDDGILTAGAFVAG